VAAGAGLARLARDRPRRRTCPARRHRSPEPRLTNQSRRQGWINGSDRIRTARCRRQRSTFWRKGRLPGFAGGVQTLTLARVNPAFSENSSRSESHRIEQGRDAWAIAIQLEQVAARAGVPVRRQALTRLFLARSGSIHRGGHWSSRKFGRSSQEHKKLLALMKQSSRLPAALPAHRQSIGVGRAIDEQRISLSDWFWNGPRSTKAGLGLLLSELAGRRKGAARSPGERLFPTQTDT